DFAARGRGLIVYLREGSVGVARHARRPRADLETETEGHGSAQSREEQWREIGIGAQFLSDLGVHSITLLASRQRYYIGLEGFGIAIEATEIREQQAVTGIKPFWPGSCKNCYRRIARCGGAGMERGAAERVV